MIPWEVEGVYNIRREKGYGGSCRGDSCRRGRSYFVAMFKLSGMFLEAKVWKVSFAINGVVSSSIEG